MASFLESLSQPDADLEAKQKEYEERKRQAAVFGGMADNLSNRQSFGSIMLGRDVGGQHPSQMIQSAIVPDKSPEEVQANRYSKLLGQLKTAKEAGDVQKQGIENAKEVALNSLDSPETRQSRLSMKAQLTAMAKGDKRYQPVIDQIDQMTGAQIRDQLKEGGLGKTMTALGGENRANIIIQPGMERNKTTLATLDERRNHNADQAATVLENNQFMAAAKKSLGSLERAQELASSKEPVTAKQFNLIKTDYINAMAAGGAATEGKIGRELQETLAEDFNNVEGMVGVVKDIRATPAFQNLMKHVDEAQGQYRAQQQREVRDWASGYASNSNPKVQAAVRNKLNYYGAVPKEGEPALNWQGQPQSAPPQTAADWLKANPNDPRAPGIRAKLMKQGG